MMQSEFMLCMEAKQAAPNCTKAWRTGERLLCCSGAVAAYASRSPPRITFSKCYILLASEPQEKELAELLLDILGCSADGAVRSLVGTSKPRKGSGATVRMTLLR